MTSSQEYAEKLSEDPSQFYDDAAVKVEESDEVKKLRAALAAAQLDAANAKTEAANAKAEVIAVKSAKKKRAPKGLYKAQCDDTMKKINPSLKYILANHKEQHRELYMLGLFVKEYTDAAPESDDHDAYKRWLTDNKEFIGLKKQTRKSTGADNVSTMTLSDMTINDDEEESEDAGAGAD